MVLEMSAPAGNQWSDLIAVIPTFIGYLISYMYIGVYWVNHHRLLMKTETVSGRTLFANLFWMFFVSLIPFATAWTSKVGFRGAPGALYSLILLLSAIAYHYLALTVEQARGRRVTIVDVMIKDRRSLFTVLVYAIAIPLAYVQPVIAYVAYVIVVIFWIATDTGNKKEMNGSGERDVK